MSVSTTVKLTVTIETPSSWSLDCTGGQVRRQSIDDVNLILRKAVEGSDGKLKLVGPPEIVNIIASIKQNK